MNNTVVWLSLQYTCIDERGAGVSGSRERIVEAIIAVVAESGIEAASVRTVAQRAGVSIGAVQHHFRTKAQMLEAAMGLISAAVTAGVEEAAGSGASPAEVLRTLAEILAIVEDDDRPMAGVWLDFVALSRVTPALAEIHRSGWARLRQTLTELIRLAHPGHPEPAAAAEAALAVFDGVAVARVAEPDFMTGARASAILDRVLGGIAAETR